MSGVHTRHRKGPFALVVSDMIHVWDVFMTRAMCSTTLAMSLKDSVLHQDVLESIVSFFRLYHYGKM